MGSFVRLEEGFTAYITVAADVALAPIIFEVPFNQVEPLHSGRLERSDRG